MPRDKSDKSDRERERPEGYQTLREIVEADWKEYVAEMEERTEHMELGANETDTNANTAELNSGKDEENQLN